MVASVGMPPPSFLTALLAAFIAKKKFSSGRRPFSILPKSHDFTFLSCAFCCASVGWYTCRRGGIMCAASIFTGIFVGSKMGSAL